MSKRHSFEVDGLHHENPIPMGCVIGNILMTSGIFGMEPGTRKFPDDIEGQCRLMFENVRRVMAAAGGSTEDIIKMVVWAKRRHSRTPSTRNGSRCSLTSTRVLRDIP